MLRKVVMNLIENMGLVCRLSWARITEKYLFHLETGLKLVTDCFADKPVTYFSQSIEYDAEKYFNSYDERFWVTIVLQARVNPKVIFL